MAYTTSETIRAERTASRAKLRYATLGIIAFFFILAVVSGIVLSSGFFILISQICLALFAYVMIHPYFK